MEFDAQAKPGHSTSGNAAEVPGCFPKPQMPGLKPRLTESDSWRAGALASECLTNSLHACYAGSTVTFLSFAVESYFYADSLPWDWLGLGQHPFWSSWSSLLSMVGAAGSQRDSSPWKQLIGLWVNTQLWLGQRILFLGLLYLETRELCSLPFIVWILTHEAISSLAPDFPRCEVIARGRSWSLEREGSRHYSREAKEKTKAQRSFKSLLPFVPRPSCFSALGFQEILLCTYIIFLSCVSWLEQRSHPIHQGRHS